MKKFKVFAIFIFLSISTSFSQSLYIKNGLSISRMTNKKDLPILNKNITNYSFFLGTEYFVHKNYEISSEIGYLVRGGSEVDLIIEPTNIVEKDDFIQLNTTIIGKITKDKNTLFIGIGPKLDISVSNRKYLDGIYSGYKKNRFLYGIKSEIGTKHVFSNKFIIGLSASYFIDFNPIIYTEYINIKNSTVLLSLQLGYTI